MSFQRYPKPLGQRAPPETPTSLGALPVARAGSGELLLPVALGEAFWIGLDGPALPRTFALRVESPGGHWWVQPLLQWAGHGRVTGYDAGLDGRLAFGGQCVRLAWTTGPVDGQAREIELRLVDYAVFAAATGTAPPAPLDRAAGYGGWRLP